ncbi:MAG: MATE family efflux transporter [Lachnospiraceae bacterium]|nr:MATE family efflux transporter [Lachnospiraceae bacterium]
MKKYIGDRAFYRMVMGIALPIMIQNGFTNFVSLLDNIMVGRVGTEQMSGVAIANQLLLVFNITIFGAVSGASIFGAQYYGLGDREGVRNTFRFKLVVSGLLTVLAVLLFWFAGEELITLYLNEEEGGRAVGDTLLYGRDYLNVMLLGLAPYAAAQSYASTLRDTGETKLPMRAGIAAVIVNLCLNYILIFGKFGAPELGAVGAAVAAVVSRFVELGIILAAVHGRRRITDIVEGAYRNFRIPAALAGKIAVTGMPLLINEALWSMGMAVMNQCYSVRGLDVVAAVNICSTVSNLFNVVFMSLGGSIAIIVGQQLGAGETEKAVDTDRKLIVFSVASCLLIGGVLAALSGVIPMIYNTEPQVRRIATKLILVAACCMPIHAFNHASYFTMRSGGKTFVTFLFDSVFVWVVNIPLAYSLAHFTSMNIVLLYLSCLLIDLVKCAIGYVLLKRRAWVKNIVSA